MKTTYFKAINLFSQASTESLDTLSQFTQRHFYKKNNLLLDYDQSKNTFLYVVSGWIKLFKETNDGVEVIVDVITQNHYCGESFMFDATEREPYKALSISDVEFLTMPTYIIKRLIVTDHIFALHFLRATLEKQQHNNNHREHLTMQNATERIACFILRLLDSKKLTLELPYDKTLLASHLGMRPETFSRALKNLSKQCGVHVQGGNINIDHPDNLIRYVYEHCSNIYPCNLH